MGSAPEGSASSTEHRMGVGGVCGFELWRVRSKRVKKQFFLPLSLLGALGISFFSGSSVVSNSDGRVSFLIRQSSLFRKTHDRQLREKASICHSFSNLSRLAHEPWR